MYFNKKIKDFLEIRDDINIKKINHPTDGLLCLLNCLVESFVINIDILKHY